eukprot:4295170-Pyramimonas_sp.AAC.1
MSSGVAWGGAMRGGAWCGSAACSSSIGGSSSLCSGLACDNSPSGSATYPLGATFPGHLPRAGGGAEVRVGRARVKGVYVIQELHRLPVLRRCNTHPRAKGRSCIRYIR